jgi:NTP pyrophosphatase (non-canonical NTP hydrolase)
LYLGRDDGDMEDRDSDAMDERDDVAALRAFNEEHDLALSPEHRVLDLVSETGELSKAVLKAGDYGAGDVERTDELADEFGDVYYCLLSLADELGVDPEAALSASLEKYRERAAEGDVGSGE